MNSATPAVAIVVFGYGPLTLLSKQYRERLRIFVIDTLRHPVLIQDALCHNGSALVNKLIGNCRWRSYPFFQLLIEHHPRAKCHWNLSRPRIFGIREASWTV